jgi:hypothetical protein
LRDRDADKAHVAAGAFANRRRGECPQTTRAKYATDDIWLAHYEGFRAGLVHAHDPQKEARLAAGSEQTKRSLAPHTLDPITSACTVCGATYEQMLDNLFPVCVPKA